MLGRKIYFEWGSRRIGHNNIPLFNDFQVKTYKMFEYILSIFCLCMSFPNRIVEFLF